MSRRQRKYFDVENGDRDTDIGNSLSDQLQALKYQYNQLEAEFSETANECIRLKQELGAIPKPRPWDAVLGAVRSSRSY